MNVDNSAKQPGASIDEYDYRLPENQIATLPLEQRDHSRMLVFRAGVLADQHFYDLPQMIPTDTLMVLNNTRVIAARIFFTKDTGGVIEVFCLNPHSSDLNTALAAQSESDWECMVGGASKWKPEMVLQRHLTINDNPVELQATIVGRTTGEFVIRFRFTQGFTFSEVLEAAGQIPLPPYMKREALEEDKERYQTVFAINEGSVAAPTASLHFTPQILKQLELKGTVISYLTLHVGAGTFKPVKVADVKDHEMHHEPFFITPALLSDLLRNENVLAVGTTSARALESLYWLCVRKMKDNSAGWHLDQWEAYELAKTHNNPAAKDCFIWLREHMNKEGLKQLSCSTSLLIMPSYQFKVVNILITNFHQPRSTLLLLIAAFLGDGWRKIYDHALANNYRFLSYGDSCLFFR